MFSLKYLGKLASSDPSNLLVDLGSLEKLALLAEVLHPDLYFFLVFVVHPPLFEVVGVREEMDTHQILLPALCEEETPQEHDMLWLS